MTYLTILPLCDIPTLRHFWKRQYWHLFRDFLWMRQWRSQWSYTNFNLIVRLKKPCRRERKRKLLTVIVTRHMSFFTLAAATSIVHVPLLDVFSSLSAGKYAFTYLNVTPFLERVKWMRQYVYCTSKQHRMKTSKYCVWAGSIYVFVIV